MSRPRCGNDPRAQLTDGDRQAIADFRAYLTRRAQEKTMDEQQLRQIHDIETGTTRKQRAEQEQQATARAEAALAPLEAKMRELKARERAEHRAAIYRELADQQEQTAATDVIRKRRSIATARRLFAVELRRMADEAQP